MDRVKVFVDPESMGAIGRFFVSFAVVYTIVVVIAYAFVLSEWQSYAKDSISVIEKSTESSLTVTCDILECEYILIDGVYLYRHGHEDYSENKKNDRFIIEKFHELTTIELKSNLKGISFGLSTIKLMAFYTNVVLVLYMLLVIQTLVFFIRYLVSHNIKVLKDGATNTASLHNKNMAVLAEQLHHELNTPLSVVKELCDRTFTVFDDSYSCGLANSKKLGDTPCTVIKHFSKVQELKRIIDNNLKQSFVVIERMAEAKQVKYSNGNKSVYDITKSTFDIMGVYNRTNYTHSIDGSLKEYVIDHSTGLKNHELMNIFLNHLKNSLEANATTIDVSLNRIVPYVPSQKDKYLEKGIALATDYLPPFLSAPIVLTLHRLLSDKSLRALSFGRITLSDNGNGVPLSFLPNLFKLNASTKERDGLVRGAGLYLNREILRSAGGDIWVHETSKKGTTFILDVPIRLKS